MGGELIVANAGDCRAVMSRRGKAIDLSTDQRPSCSIELARIELELTRLTEGAVGEHGDGSASSTASERSSSDSDSDKSVSDQVASHTRKVPGPRNARAQAGVEAARRRGVDGKSFARLSPAMLRAPTRQRWAYMSGA